MVGVKILSIASFQSFLGADLFNSISQSDLYALTNQARRENQLPLLNQNPKLELAAQLKLNDMLQNGYFAHVSPAGITPWIWIGKANYDYSVAGENLAMNFYNSDDTMKAWLNSDTHRRNILLPEFQDIGIAVGSGIINNQNTVVVVQEFGKPKIMPLPVQVAQRPPPTPKPITVVKVTPKPKLKVTAKPKATTIVVVSPKSLPKISVVPTTSVLSAAKPIITPVSLAQVKSEMSYATQNKTGVTAYSYNLFLDKMTAILFAIMLAIMTLKIFVNINVQVPELILRAAILIILGAIFSNLNDPRLLSLINGSVILP